VEETKDNSKKLWTHAKETLNLDQLNKKSAKLGVQDKINLKFSKQVFQFQAEKLAVLENDEELPDHMKENLP
jgi:hypothetical protein